MSWGYVIAGAIGAIVFAIGDWLIRRLKGSPSGSLMRYDPKKAEKERKRITGHAESERDKVKDVVAKGKRAVDDF